MKTYEIMFILAPKEQDAIEVSINKYINLINRGKNRVTRVDRWGMKRLAYEIRDLSKGYYVLATFRCTARIVDELDAEMKRDDNVLRFMIVEKD